MLFDASELTAPYLQILLNGKIGTVQNSVSIG